MHIAAIETYPICLPLRPECRMISALGRHEESSFVLVRLLTDAGIEGAGEATVTARWSGETVWGAQAMIDRVLAPPLVGCDLAADPWRASPRSTGSTPSPPQLVRQVGHRNGLLGHPGQSGRASRCTSCSAAPAGR